MLLMKLTLLVKFVSSKTERSISPHIRPCGVTVSTLDSESSDRGSNPRRTFFWFFFAGKENEGKSYPFLEIFYVSKLKHQHSETKIGLCFVAVGIFVSRRRKNNAAVEPMVARTSNANFTKFPSQESNTDSTASSHYATYFLREFLCSRIDM